MTETLYFRPLAQTGGARPDGAETLAGGVSWFTHLERLQRGKPAKIVTTQAVPAGVLATLTRQRAAICGLDVDTPLLMGVLNVTPDSFSDGGRFVKTTSAAAQAQALIAAGADILDIGGESTRPGADTVTAKDEIARTAPVIRALQDDNFNTPISIDTRKSTVAAAALGQGASMVNDVSALGFDTNMLALLQNSDVPICLMHAGGPPKTMQKNPVYDDVLLDVYDDLETRINFCVSGGIDRARIIVDPGIGFGKTAAHNLALIRGLSLFHGLGCVVLLGVSRKRFIGTIGQEPQADRRAPGSIALALEGVRQGVQILRVHDIRDTRQALRLWQASR